MNAMVSLSSAMRKKPVPPMEHRAAALCMWTALAEMVNGTARREEWTDLANCLNVVEALRAMGRIAGEDLETHIQRGIDGLMVAIKCPDGMMRMGKDAMFSMRHIVTLHDDAIGRYSRQTLYDAHDLVVKRIADPKAGPHNGLYVVNA